MNFERKNQCLQLSKQEYPQWPQYYYMMPPMGYFWSYGNQQDRHQFFKQPSLQPPTNLKTDDPSKGPPVFKEQPSLLRQVQCKVEVSENKNQEYVIKLSRNRGNQSQIEKSQQSFTMISLKEKEYITKMFESSHKNEDAYFQIMNQIKYMDPNYVEMMRRVYGVLSGFQKVKSEHIRTVLNRTTKFYQDTFKCKRDSRFKYNGGFKSMGHQYIQALFKDTGYVQCFQEMALIFGEEYEKMNQQKINRILEIVENNNSSLLPDLVIDILNKKPNIPEPIAIRKKAYHVYLEILEEYTPENLQASAALRRFVDQI